MPKVSEEYFIQKKKQIVEAAYRLCLKKPVGNVTMTDLIAETGLSQGGIYRFFPDLDSILQAMILQMRDQFGIIQETDDIFASYKDKSTAEFCDAICTLLADRIEETLMDIQKINFDLTVLAINDPKRVAKILKDIPSEGNTEHLTKSTMALLEKQIQSGKCNPKVSSTELMQFISCAYSGIIFNCIVSNCYSDGPMSVKYSPRPMFATLAKTIPFLLGE